MAELYAVLVSPLASAVLDPALCQETVVNAWVTLTWNAYHLLTRPTLILTLLLMLSLGPWLLSRLSMRWKGGISGVGLLLLVSYVLVGSPIGVALGDRLLVYPVPPDTGETADAIVVLGRGSELRPDRVDVAADLWQSQRAPLVFASGRGDAVEIAEQLESQGLPSDAIAGEPCSRTTEENAQFSALLLKPQSVKRILLVTDPPHMLRSLLTFRSLGFEVIPHLSPLPQPLSNRHEGILLLREYVGLAAYSILGRFSTREVSADEVASTQGRLPQL